MGGAEKPCRDRVEVTDQSEPSFFRHVQSGFDESQPRLDESATTQLERFITGNKFRLEPLEGSELRQNKSPHPRKNKCGQRSIASLHAVGTFALPRRMSLFSPFFKNTNIKIVL
jgi:hypothetical protein